MKEQSITVSVSALVVYGIIVSFTTSLTYCFSAVEGDILRAFFADTDKVVSDIEIKRDQSLCTVYQLGFFRSTGL